VNAKAAACGISFDRPGRFRRRLPRSGGTATASKTNRTGILRVPYWYRRAEADSVRCSRATRRVSADWREKCRQSPSAGRSDFHPMTGGLARANVRSPEASPSTVPAAT